MNVKIKCDKKTLVKQIKTTDDVIEALYDVAEGSRNQRKRN